ncbi:PilN domain-containing protein [bacterium]|nr:PilN domain-containing protein [bacterium]
MKKTLFNINLYMPEKKKKKVIKPPRDGRFMGIVAFFAAIVLILVIGYLFFGIYIPQMRMIEDAHSEEERLESQLQGIKAVSQRLARKKGLYLDIRGEAVSWPEKLLAIMDALPESIWLHKLDFQGRSGDVKGGQTLTISGFTFSGAMKGNLDQIGIFLTNINQSAEFEAEFDPLRLDFTRKSKSEQGTVEFQLTGKARDLALSAYTR